jgi:hypothetical protein
MKAVGTQFTAEEQKDQINAGNTNGKTDYHNQCIQPVPENTSEDLF